jgi:hypothetical protein
MTRLLNATSSIANKTDPSAASETRFTFSLSIGRTFVAGVGLKGWERGVLVFAVD